MQLRPYQEEAVSAIFKAWEEFDKTLLVLPTGCGKTLTFAKVAERRVQGGGKALVLAHREELLRQAQDKIFAATGLSCAFERASENAVGSVHPITCGSVQTLMRKSRLEAYPRNHYNTIIVDEAHHALSDSYQNILEYFAGAKVLGVTATPDRGDKQNLSRYFESVAYEYSIRTAIREGYLSRIAVQTIPLSISLSGVKTTAGDYSADDLGNAIDPYLERIAQYVPRDGKTLIFLPLIATSKRMTEILLGLGYKAEHIDGISQERQAILERFHTGECGVLCNSMLLTEGFDEPSIDCIICLRPTKIRSLYAQIIGRGTRICEGKTQLRVLDFLWQTERHNLCHPAHLIATHEDIAEKMTELAQKGATLDLQDLEKEAMESARIEREESLAEVIRANADRKGKLIDPMEFALFTHDDGLEGYVPTFRWEKESPTQKQLELLERFGIHSEAVETRGQASMLLNRLIGRRHEKLATPRQVKLLHSFGISQAAQMSYAEASARIDAIAQNGWKRKAWTAA